MAIDLGLGEWIIIGLSAFLFIWYFAANSYNRRRGIATYRWLYSALENVGKIAHSEWIGSSNAGARLLVDKAQKPFRRADAIYLLEPREFLPYWVASLLQGKRDEVKIQITLRNAPKSQFEVRKLSGKEKVQTTHDQNETLTTEQTLGDFYINFAGVEDRELMAKAERFLLDYADVIKSIDLESKAPQLVIRTQITPLLKVSGEDFIAGVVGWFQE